MLDLKYIASAPAFLAAGVAATILFAVPAAADKWDSFDAAVDALPTTFKLPTGDTDIPINRWGPFQYRIGTKKEHTRYRILFAEVANGIHIVKCSQAVADGHIGDISCGEELGEIILARGNNKSLSSKRTIYTVNRTGSSHRLSFKQDGVEMGRYSSIRNKSVGWNDTRLFDPVELERRQREAK